MVFALLTIIHLISSIIMEHPELLNLKYGIIYIYSDSSRKAMTMSHGVADLLRKFVYPMDIEWVEDPGRDGFLVAARRFNLGNIGQYATVSMRLSATNDRGGQSLALHRFTDVLMGLSDTKGGDIFIDEADFALRPSIRYSIEEHDMSCYEAAPPMPSAAPQDHTRVESTVRKIKKKLSKRLKKTSGDLPEIMSEVCYDQKPQPTIDLLQSEQTEVENLERERKRALERIRHEIINYIAQYHDDPTDLMQELLRGKVVVGTPGRVLVNGEMKIILPEYDETEIEMPAMCRTLYILFMKLRKQGESGIVLKDIDQYRDELINIYGLVKPGANEDRVERTVDNLCDPLGDSLHQTISRINRCVRSVISNKKLVHDYCITGTRSEPYSIALDPQFLELPRAVIG